MISVCPALQQKVNQSPKFSLLKVQFSLSVLDSTGASQYSILYDDLPFFKSTSVVQLL